MSAESRRRIARETLEIYAPIAQRLGMNRDQGRAAGPRLPRAVSVRHAVIAKRIRQPAGGAPRGDGHRSRPQLAQRLAQEGLPHRLVSRIKSPWSIYTKMRSENKKLRPGDGRVRLPHRGARQCMQCYHALGAVHSLFKPLDARFRDFIAIPKANGYQSLHTVLFGPYGSPIEVQIRTEEMDLVAERGIAAHWAVQERRRRRSNSAQSRARRTGSPAWSTASEFAGSSLEFLENVKVDLFPDEVYLFTPEGRHPVACRAMPPRSTSPMPCIPMSATTPSPRASTASWCRCAPSCVSGQTRRDHHRAVGHARARSGWNSWSPARRAPRSATTSSTSNTRMRCDLGHRMLDRALETAGHLARPPAGRRSSMQLPGRAPLPAPGGAAGRHRAGQPHAGAGRACAAAERQQSLPTTRRSRCASSEQILITGSERGVLSFAQLLPSDPGRRDHGLPHRRQGHRGAPRWTARTWPNTASRPSAGCRSPGTARSRAISDAALRIEVENKPGRAGPGGRGGRRMPIPTSTRSNTRSATAHLGDAFLHRGAQPQAPGRRDPADAAPGRGARRRAAVGAVTLSSLHRRSRPCPAPPSTPTRRRPPSVRIRRPCAAATPCICPGQIPLDPATGATGRGRHRRAGPAGVRQPARRSATPPAARSTTSCGVGIYLTDLWRLRRGQRGDGRVLQRAVSGPLDDRRCSALPRGAQVEVDAILAAD